MNLEEVETDLRSRWLAGLNGNGAAYEQALRQVALRLHAFFERRMRDAESAVEDLVQETLMALHHQRHSYDPELPFTVWVHAIARYKWYDHLRSRGRQRGLFESWLDERDGLVAGAEDVSTAARDLDILLARLPLAQRSAIEHVRLKGDSVAEAALALGVSESALKVQVHRGMKRLMAMTERN